MTKLESSATEPIRLTEFCRNATNYDGDRFVGIKVDTNKVEICFPIGYHLPETNEEARGDIYALIKVLSAFSPHKSGAIHFSGAETSGNINFPINAYLEVIQYYLEHHSYFRDRDSLFKVSDCGQTDWTRTIKRQRPVIQANGSPVYLNRIVRSSSPKKNQYITEIHKYCVYESFQKIGWLFTKYTPEKSSYKIEPKSAIFELRSRLSCTNNDKTKKLLSAMISILSYIDKNTDQHRAYFGTDNFEYIWEKIIDHMFGVTNKEIFFPKASWNIRGDKNRTFEALYPDTIMLVNDSVYVLDAKYYRYGTTNNILHLPEGSSIHKQITYGEYISNNQKFVNSKTGEHPTVYNAFLLPFDSVKANEAIFYNFGEATGEWKTRELTYEVVKGICVDTKYIMLNYANNSLPIKHALARMIQYGK